jgi:hypothetical protein
MTSERSSPESPVPVPFVGLFVVLVAFVAAGTVRPYGRAAGPRSPRTGGSRSSSVAGEQVLDAGRHQADHQGGHAEDQGRAAGPTLEAFDEVADDADDRARTNGTSSCSVFSENTSTGRLAAPATDTAPASSAVASRRSCRRSRPPPSPCDATTKANECAIARPTVLPDRMAISSMPTGLSTGSCPSSCPAGNAASVARRTIET